jgi:integrase
MSQSDLDRFVSQRRAQGVVDKTINGDLIILRAALNHGVAIGLLQKLPFKVKLLKVPKRRIAPILSPQDIQRLLSLASGRIFGILLVAVYTGFRNSEIVHLKWRDVGWADASLNVTTKDGIWSSKNHQERKVFVPEEVLNWLRAYRDRAQFAGESDWIFSTKRGTPLTTFNTCHAIRHVFEAAGLYRRGVPTLHLIRHTVACNLLQGGVDIETVRDWLGHADISTTALYLHSTDARKRAAASALRGLHCVVSATVNQVGVSDVFGEPKSPLEGGES